MSQEKIWQGCYDDSWKGLITDESFQHPAKFARGLIRRIYQHAVASGYVKPGDVVVDPFGGVSLGALDAMQAGLRWRGCELEQRFVDLGNANLEKWRRAGLTGGVLVQGDSRMLCWRLAGATADACVGSPPFIDARQDTTASRKGATAPTKHDPEAWTKADCVVSSPPYSGNEKHDYRDDEARYRGKPQGVGCFNGSETYGPSPENLGNMPTGSVDAVVSSPPYASGVVHGGSGINQDALSGNTAGVRSQARTMDGYGTAPGNLGNLPAGDVSAIVSSPPYEGSVNADSHGIDWSKVGHATGNRKREGSKCDETLRSQMKYGSTPGNVGNDTGATFWQAAKEICQQCFQILKPGGVSIWVLKAFVRGGEIQDFPGDWRRLCEAVGFEFVEEIHASLVKRTEHPGLFGEPIITTKERKSFFRRLHEKKRPDLKIDYEVVLIVRKP